MCIRDRPCDAAYVEQRGRSLNIVYNKYNFHITLLNTQPKTQYTYCITWKKFNKSLYWNFSLKLRKQLRVKKCIKHL